MDISRMPADPGELDGVYATLRPLLLSIAYEMVGAIGEAEDIVQEAFLRFHREVAERHGDQVREGVALDRHHPARRAVTRGAPALSGELSK
ncbi:MAG: hypothetical protein ICV70_00575 [Jiangellaceae bacterium]|nr:hypothetical protein [Jiangellaceae bacterium]